MPCSSYFEELHSHTENRRQIRVCQTASGSRNRGAETLQKPCGEPNRCLRSYRRSYREIGRRGARLMTTVRGWDPGDPRSYLARLALISADLSPRSIPTTNRGFGLVCVYNAYVRGRYHLRRADRPPPKPTGGEGYRDTKVIKRTG